MIEFGRDTRSRNRLATITLFVAVSLAAMVPAWAQSSPNAPPADANPVAQALENNPSLLTALQELFQKLQQNAKFPAPRSQSRLLPLLPESTIFYAAIPNYGDAAHQMLATFHEQLEHNQDLHTAWEKTPWAGQTEAKFEDSIEKFYQFSQYIGDEIVFSGSPNAKNDPSLLMVTEIRKPGLKDFLAALLKDVSAKSADVEILDPLTLPTAKSSGKKFFILVRPDFLAASTDLSTLRQFNAQVAANHEGFASTPFGERITQAYEGGVSFVGGLDCQKLLDVINPKGENRKLLNATGFSDAKYIVWRHQGAEGHASSEFELSFSGPRRGIASWVAAPGPIGGLEFVSPDATMVVSLLLKNPGEIFDDIMQLSSASNPNAMASITQMEQGLNISLRNDLLAQLTGEITIESEAPGSPKAAWKAILRAHDASRLQATLKTLFAATHVPLLTSQEDDVTYYTFQIPNPQKPQDVNFTFSGDYLVIGSSHQTVADAISLHKSGDSLAKSSKLAAALPPAPQSEVSALFYEDPAAMMAYNLRQAPPELAKLFTSSTASHTPSVMYVYGEPTAIRTASRSAGMDIGAVLVVAAIAIPNLIRARSAANEASAVASLRTINVAQITYSATYPDRGYAHDLATLGPNPTRVNETSALHAGLIDNSLGLPGCIAGSWCTKDGYRFSVKATCIAEKCTEFVAVATPESGAAGNRNFCSTSAAVIRFQIGAPLDKPITALQCRRWQTLH